MNRNKKFIPVLLNRDAPDEKLRQVLSLSVKRGGLALNLPDDYDQNYQHSLLLSQPLDSAEQDIAALQQHQIKKDINKARSAREAEKISSLTHNLDDEEKHTLNLVTEKGASAWLNALPLKSTDYGSIKGTFVMHYVSDTAGSSETSHLNVHAVRHLSSPMPSIAQKEDIP